jgi:hypothetical protein
LSWNNLDVVSFDDDALFSVTDQIADGPRPPSEPLDRTGHVFRLVEKGISQVGSPIHILGHHSKNAWIVGNCPDGLSPILLVNARHIPSALEPHFRIGNLCRIRRGRQHLGQQRVRVERDRGEKAIKLIIREGY